ncbi:hypothetical protein B0J17DRAFT_773178 [Rhizoctonia solani]|nr:hypothetical protein B0J17DRAFT_773178 [Rhizoctonia solani]
MLAFSRLTSILFFVLSLSFLACAHPTPAAKSNALAARDPGADLLNICANLEADVKAKCDAIAKVDIKVLADIEVEVKAIVSLVDVAAKAIPALGVKIDIGADVKAQVAVHIAAVIKLVVNLCVTLVAKLGITVLLTLLAKIDVCLQLLLSNLAIVAHGIVALIAKLLVDVTAQVFLDASLKLCLSVLLPAGLSL